MAYLLKKQNRPSSDSRPDDVIQQWIQKTQPAVALPQSTTGQIFRVYGGRILCHLILGEVTTVIQAQATTIKVTSQKLSNAAATVGTAVDLCATVDGTGKEVGSLYRVLGSGAAAIWSNAGAALATLGAIPMIIPQGEIYLTTVASSTGAMKWDIFYQPLDAGAYVLPAVLTSGALTAAI